MGTQTAGNTGGNAAEGVTASDAVLAAGAAETGWLFKKQVSTLLRTTWKATKFIAKRYPYAMAALVAYEALSTEAAKHAMSEIMASVGKDYGSANSWADDMKKDENVIHASMDAINAVTSDSGGVLATLPPDVRSAIPQGVQAALEQRKANVVSLPSSAKTKHVWPETKNIDLLNEVGSIFGTRSPDQVHRLSRVLKSFLELSEADLARACEAWEAAR
jgi:hypothetical protein